MRRLVALLAVALTALTATTATAQQAPKLARAQQVAAAVWHNPCAEDHVTIVRGLPDDEDGGDTASTWVEACIIYVDPGALDGPYPILCTVLLHEYGHLAGYRDPTNIADPEHSSNPSSIMASRMRLFTSSRIRGRTVWGPDVDRRCLS